MICSKPLLRIGYVSTHATRYLAVYTFGKTKNTAQYNSAPGFHCTR